MEGILLVNKPQGKTSFDLIRILRKRLQVQKIGHAGTLDPLATGIMILLIGRRYTKLSEKFLSSDKEYKASIFLGSSTDTLDAEGNVTNTSSHIPELDDIVRVLSQFQGEIEQVPPMFSAKKWRGKKLYELARKKQVIPRLPVKIILETSLISYAYPYLDIKVACSKGTYIRSLADDIGRALGCYAHLAQLTRTRSGTFSINECVEGFQLNNLEYDLSPYLRTL